MLECFFEISNMIRAFIQSVFFNVHNFAYKFEHTVKETNLQIFFETFIALESDI